jgi:hypothetical protein
MASIVRIAISASKFPDVESHGPNRGESSMAFSRSTKLPPIKVIDR